MIEAAWPDKQVGVALTDEEAEHAPAGWQVAKAEHWDFGDLMELVKR